MNFLSNSNNHPLIPNSNNYLYEQRYVSIHSNDRDVVKYPRSAEFEIELPQDYTNIVSARLHSWSIPSNYNVFSIQNFNIFAISGYLYFIFNKSFILFIVSCCFLSLINFLLIFL